MVLFTNYEAWYNDVQIYNGSSKREMIYELLDFIEHDNRIDETLISEEEIKELDEEALEKVGIKLYITNC